MRNKYFISLLFTSLFTLVFSQSMQNEGDLGKNNQQFQKDQVELPDWVDPETGIDQTTNQPYVKIPYKPVEKAAIVSPALNKPLPAWADQILIIEYGSYNDEFIRSAAEAAGHVVTAASSLPSDVSSYNQIWDYGRFFSALSSSDMTKLKTVLENGGTVYLTGERSCCAPRNNSIVSFIQDVGGGDDVAIATSDAGSSSNILQSDFRTPNNITDVQYGSSGYFSNIGNGTAITKTNNSSSQITAATWNDLSAPYTGKIIAVLDVNIWTDSYINDSDNVKYLENIVALAETAQPPTGSSADLAADNTYIDITMSTAVYNATGGSGALEATDFTLTFAQNSGSATAASISSVKQNDNTAEASATALAGGETVIRIFLSITGTPSGVETITITPVDGSSIFDASDRAMSSSQTTGAIALNDKLAPTISSVSLAANNSTIAVTFSDAVYNTNGGSGSLEAADFVFSISGGTATLSSVTPTSISISGNVYTLGISLSGTADGTEVLTVNPVDDSIYDENGNEASTTQSNNTATLNDVTGPTITSVSSTTANGTYGIDETIAITITFSENAIVNSDLFEQDGTGRPRLTLETGSSDHATNYTSGSGGATLTWNYTVQSGNISSDLDYKSLALNGGTIKDATGNDADLTTLPSPGASGSLAANKALVVDGVVPTIYSAAVASNNSYIDITMSEAVYNANAGSGALEATDFTLTFVQNSGNATAASISSVKKNDGSATALVNGAVNNSTALVVDGYGSPVPDGTIVAGMVVTGTGISGSVTVTTVTNQNTLVLSSAQTLVDNASLVFTAPEGSATALAGGETVIRAFLSFTGTPSGVETITITPVNAASIYDVAGNAMAASQTTGAKTASDQLLPTITSVSLAANNSTIAVTLSESVYNTNDGSGALVEASDFAFSISGGTATLSSATPSGLSPNGNVYTLDIDLSGTPNGAEVLTVNPVDDSIYDATGNEASTSQSNNTVTLNDQAGPTISSVSLASNNSSIAVTFSEAVYNATGGSGALEASDFSFSIIGGTATLASATPSSISPNGNVYTLGISLSGTPNGSEVLTVNPMDDSIYDSDGNEASMSQSNNTATLNDDIFPIITSISLAANNSTLAVTFSEAVYNTNGGSGALEVSDFVFSTTLGTATLSSTAPTSISISGNVYTLGIGLSGNPDGDEVLVVNPVDDSIYDAAGNEASTSQSNNTVELNEKIVPIISSVALASDNSTLAVTFSEAVYNATGGSGALEVSDFSFSITGGTATLTSTTPSTITISGNVYTLGITLTGTPDGSEVLRVNPKDDSIYDAQNNEASTSQSNNTATLNDNTVPTVTSVSSITANGTYFIGSMVQVTTIFSEEVLVTGTPQITLKTGATANSVVNYASGSGTNTLTFNYTVASGDTTSDLDYTATTSLALNSGTIKDAAGNVATLTLASPGADYSLGLNKALVIDGNAPTVSSVTSAKANGAYSVNDTIPINVTFSQTVAVTGTPQLTVETGATDGVANYVSVSGATITFDYIVASGHTSSDLDYTGTSALTLNTGTIKDASGNAATLTLPAPAASNSLGANKALIIDTTGPTVTSVSSTTDNGAYNAGDTINVSVTFSENTVVTGTPQITMETGTADGTGNYVSGTGTTVLSFDYIVASSHHSADLDYENTSALILNAGTLKDAQGNNATLTLASPGATNSLGASKAILIDTAVPLIHLAAEGGILGIDGADYQSASTTLDISWSGSDSLSGIYKYEYALGTTSGGTETISWTDASTNPDLLASTSVSLTALTLTDATKYYVSARATDKAGNLSAVKTGDGVTIDVTAPKAGTIHDGSGADIAYTSAANTLSGNWTGFSDVTSGITDYQYAIGTTSGGIDVKGWTSNTTDTSFTVTGYNLTNAQAYYLSVKAVDMVGHVSDTVTSNGVIADQDAPTKGIVIDGLTVDRAITNTDTIYASWSGFADTLSGISKYQYAVGRSTGASDVVDWTDNGLDTSITIKPSMDDANSYYVSVRAVDHVNNTSSASTSDGVRADYLPPSIIDVSIVEWSTLPILNNAKIIFTFSEPVTAVTSNVVSYAGDTVSDSLKMQGEATMDGYHASVTLVGPFTSGDELAVKINGLTDMAGNVTNDLVYLYNIALLGDYDLDGDIGVTDLATFTAGWAAGDLTLELGPTIGAAPNLKPIPDGKYSARDMMAFTRMWHWNTSKLGKVGAKVLANQGKALNAAIENDHIVFNPPRGTRAVELILDYPATDIQFSIPADQQVTAEEGLILSNMDTLNGNLVYQAGYFEVNNKPVRINIQHLQKGDIAVNLSYQFIGDDNIVLSAGSEALELTPVPKEFSLQQNYPNPFNPVTTINYDLPKDAYVNLVIYDILGREIVNLVGKDMPAGYQTVIWNTRNQFGSPVAAGIYFYQIQTRDFVKTKKMVLLK